MTFNLAAAAAYQYLDVRHALDQVGDAQALLELLPMLQDSLQNDIPQISTLLSQGDIQGANGLLHPLKGFMPIFCNAPLCDLVATAEKLSKGTDVPALAVVYTQLRPQLETLLGEVVDCQSRVTA